MNRNTSSPRIPIISQFDIEQRMKTMEILKSMKFHSKQPTDRTENQLPLHGDAAYWMNQSSASSLLLLAIPYLFVGRKEPLLFSISFKSPGDFYLLYSSDISIFSNFTPIDKLSSYIGFCLLIEVPRFHFFSVFSENIYIQSKDYNPLGLWSDSQTKFRN